MTKSIFSGLDRKTLEHAARTTAAATVSLALARLLGLHEPQWAAISTMVVTQSTLGAALTISGERFAGTALGAAAGALLGTYLGSSLLIFAAGVFGLGLICGLLHLDRAAYRFAGITLAIVVLVSRETSFGIIALHPVPGSVTGNCHGPDSDGALAGTKPRGPRADRTVVASQSL